MKKGLLDFHTHSTHSDGSDNPAELIKIAKERGVLALALTDHNEISGLREFNFACKREGVFGIPFGTEIYAGLPKDILSERENEAPDLIILGKNVKINAFSDYQNFLIDYKRKKFIPETIEKLRGIGFDIPHFNLEEQAQMGVASVFHYFLKNPKNIDVLAKYVLEREEEISREEIEKQPIRFINQYIYSVGNPGYVRRIDGFEAKDAVNLAETMNCKLFIAHPGGAWDCPSDKVLEYYIKIGIHGIEVRNYYHTLEQNEKFDKLAKERNLVRSGGSDYHGNNGKAKIGMYDVPENQLQSEILEELWDNLPD